MNLNARLVLTKTEEAVPKLSQSTFARVLLIGVLCGAAFYPTVVGLVTEWWTNPFYSHGFLIPILSGYMLWQERSRLVACAKQPSWTGLGLFMIGLVLLVAGALGEEEFIERLSIPITLFGLVYFLGGPQTAITCLFPAAYLLLMIPLPFFFSRFLKSILRPLDAKLAASWASYLGVIVYQEGDFIHLPNITLEVADGCTGFMSLLALSALGAFYVYRLPGKKKLILWVSVVPIAVVANVIRILVIVLVVYYSGEWFLDSWFHHIQGTSNFLFGLLLLVLLDRAVGMRPGTKAEPL